MTGAWLKSWLPPSDARPLLVCLAAAGAGCGQYGQWQHRFGERVRVLGVQLPGREERWAEPPAASIDEVMDAVLEPVAAEIRHNPAVVFGHSLGGLLGYELVRRLDETRGVAVDALVVAACRPPHMWVGDDAGLRDSDLPALLAEREADIPDVDDESWEMLLGTVRHDVELSRSLPPRPDAAPLRCDIHVWGGSRDSTVTAEHLALWRPYTAAAFRQREFRGGHYFQDDHLGTVIATLDGLFGAPAPTLGGDGTW